MNRIILILLIIFIFSCKKEESVIINPTPMIKFQSLVYGVDKDDLDNDIIFTKLTLDYTDGDSNLGSDKNNCYVLLSKKVDGFFIADTTSFFNPDSFTIPPVNAGKTSILKPITINSKDNYSGEFIIDLIYPQNMDIIKNGDTIKYSVQVMDRDSLLSNIAEMEMIINL